MSVYYPWVDWAKTIGIFLVILGHGGLVNEDIRQFVYSFHMPLFFVISGILYKPVSFTITVNKYFHRLIIPYFIMNGICLLIVSLAALKNDVLTWSFLGDRIGAIVLGLGYQSGRLIPVDGPTWFLIALFIVYIIQSFGYDKRYYSIIIASLSIVIVAILSTAGIDTYLPIDSALMAYPFFCLGLYLRNIVHKQIRIRNNIFIFILMLLGTLTVSCINGRVDMNTFNHGYSLLLYYICGLFGSAFIISLSKMINCVPNFVKTISIGTILILGFNLMAISLFKGCYGLFFYREELSSFIGFVLAVVILLAFYPIIVFCSRYFHQIIGK